MSKNNGKPGLSKDERKLVLAHWETYVQAVIEFTENHSRCIWFDVDLVAYKTLCRIAREYPRIDESHFRALVGRSINNALLNALRAAPRRRISERKALDELALQEFQRDTEKEQRDANIIMVRIAVGSLPLFYQDLISRRWGINGKRKHSERELAKMHDRPERWVRRHLEKGCDLMRPLLKPPRQGTTA